MNHAILPQTNGATAYPPEAWLKQTVRQFCNAINWDDQPPEIQHLRLSHAEGEAQSLSLFLTVNQFFSSFNWAGDGTAPSPQFRPEPASDPATDTLTLDDFSDLF
jgi:hypothetical protein